MGVGTMHARLHPSLCHENASTTPTPAVDAHPTPRAPYPLGPSAQPHENGTLDQAPARKPAKRPGKAGRKSAIARFRLESPKILRRSPRRGPGGIGTGSVARNWTVDRGPVPRALLAPGRTYRKKGGGGGGGEGRGGRRRGARVPLRMPPRTRARRMRGRSGEGERPDGGLTRRKRFILFPSVGCT